MFTKLLLYNRTIIDIKLGLQQRIILRVFFLVLLSEATPLWKSTGHPLIMRSDQFLIPLSEVYIDLPVTRSLQLSENDVFYVAH